MQTVQNILMEAAKNFPYAGKLDHKLIKVKETVEFTIFEMILSAFNESLPLNKSIRSYLCQHYKTRENLHTVDAKVREIQRAHAYAQKYRLKLHDRILAERGEDISELAQQAQQVKRGAGYKLDDMRFYELGNITELGIIKKIVSKEICSQKKVSDEMFRILMDEYDRAVASLQDGMKDSKSIVFNTCAFFNLEWLFNIDIIYEIAMAAEMRGIEHVDAPRLVCILGARCVPLPNRFGYTNELYEKCVAVAGKNLEIEEPLIQLAISDGPLLLPVNTPLFTYNRMLHIREKFIPELFGEADKIFHLTYDLHLCLNYELFYLGGKPFYKTVQNSTSIDDWADFIKAHFWIRDIHPQKKDWTPDRIRIAREIYDYVIIDDV